MSGTQENVQLEELRQSQPVQSPSRGRNGDMVITIDDQKKNASPEASPQETPHSGETEVKADDEGKDAPSRLRFWRRQKAYDDRLERIRYESLEEYPPGYPRFSAFISSDENFAVYRRFATLRNRLLLHKQAKIASLEQSLKELDHADDIKGPGPNGEARWRIQSTIMSPKAKDVKRRDLLEEISRELKEYDKMLARERALLSLPKPSPRNHRSVLGYLWDEKPVVEDEADYIHQVDDFVILTNNQDSLFEAFLEEWISSIPLDCVRNIFSTKAHRARTADKGLKLYSNTRINYLARSITSFITIGLLILPVYLLFAWPASNNKKLLIIFVAMLIFTNGLLFFSKARNHELFAITAAYCAVLVVFLGNIVANANPPS